MAHLTLMALNYIRGVIATILGRRLLIYQELRYISQSRKRSSATKSERGLPERLLANLMPVMPTR